MPARKVIPETPAERTSALSRLTEGREAVDPGNDIDTRLKALNADHIEMGARPKKDADNGDLYDSKYPLRLSGAAAHTAAKDNPKPAAKKAADK